MSPEKNLRLAYVLLPGFGFYAPKGAFKRTVQVHQSVRKLAMFFDSGTPRSYLFPRFTLIGRNGVELNKHNIIERVELSDDTSGEDAEMLKQAIVSGKHVKSSRALRPSLTIYFKEVIFLSHIHLLNRKGQSGRKARHICIDCYAQGNLVSTFRNITPSAILTEAQAVHTDLNIGWPTEDTTKIEQHCQLVRKTLMQALRKGEINWGARRIANFLNVFEPQIEDTQFKTQILAEVMANLLTRKAAVPTATFVPFSSLLNSPKRLENIVELANQIVHKRTGHHAQFVAGKHAIQESRLQLKKGKYLTALDTLFPALRACGVKPMLAYGSLLGAVRDGSFIAHDDDVDVLYFDSSQSREEALRRREELLPFLARQGFKLQGNLTMPNFHLSNGEVTLDLFPCWQEGDQAHVMRKYPQYEPFPMSAFQPSGATSLYDRTYPTVANPSAFLAWRYGDDWQTPNPYHEWPWKMQADD